MCSGAAREAQSSTMAEKKKEQGKYMLEKSRNRDTNKRRFLSGIRNNQATSSELPLLSRKTSSRFTEFQC